MTSPAPYAIGIDLGGSSVKSVLVTAEGKALSKDQHDFDAAAPMDWAMMIRDLVLRYESRQGVPASWVGLSAPGLAARDGRSIAHMPGRLKGLEGLHWTEFLKRETEVPVLNDGHAALLGEAWLGAARGFEDVIMLTLGTGVGGAAIVDGKLLLGQIGRAGHLGHTCLDPEGPPDVCGTPGSIEVAIGNCTLRERTGGRFETTHDLVAACSNGDDFAKTCWLKSVKALACALGSFINILDPEAILIGGGIARAGASLFEPLEEFLRPVEWMPGGHRVKIIPAALGAHAGAFGAAWNGLGVAKATL
ncbi:MAG TPA: ROK family protein [Methylomirabilota bacterium]|nr:ROK family protein [Methylomirabilota bacterium]